MLRELVLHTRAYRRFWEDVPVSHETLIELVDLARLTASAGNRQPLRYVLSATAERNAQIFATLGWAGYLTDWPGPEENERPTAYIIVLTESDTPQTLILGTDLGIASQTILLAASERGLGGCIFHSVKRERLANALGIPEGYDILQVIALGKPKEKVLIEEIPAGGDIKYWRDAEDVHHVPKRKLEDVILTL